MPKKQFNKSSEKKKDSWRNYSLEQLENRSWGKAEDGVSNLVRRCLSLAKIPVKDLTAGDLRVLIGQQFSLVYLIPLAVEKLKENILLDAELYEGDLLNSLLQINTIFWDNNKHYWDLVNDLINENMAALNETDTDVSKFRKAKFYNMS